MRYIIYEFMNDCLYMYVVCSNVPTYICAEPVYMRFDGNGLFPARPREYYIEIE